MLEYCHPSNCHKLNGNAYVANLDGVCSGAIVWSRNGVENFFEFIEHKKFLRTIDVLILDFFKTRNGIVLYTYPRAMRQDRETFTDMTTRNDVPACPENSYEKNILRINGATMIKENIIDKITRFMKLC